MPLNKFESEDKWGLKNNSDKIIVEPIYDSIFLAKNGAVASIHIYEEHDDYGKLIIFSIDSSGDKIANITKELEKQGIEKVLEFWQLNENLFAFQYLHWNSMELTGVFNQYGQLIIKPDYDEVELISENLLLCFHGEHYEEYDELGNKNYGKKLFNVNGDKIEDESIKDYEELENGEFLFITDSERKIYTNKFGRVKK